MLALTRSTFLEVKSYTQRREMDSKGGTLQGIQRNFPDIISKL